jgi:hypothetical protein
MLKPQLQVLVDCLVGNLAQQRKVGNANLLLLCALEDGLSDLGLAPRLPAVAHISGRFGATEPALLLPTCGTS